MTRLLVALMFAHHIEGQCKPWSAATLAARELAAGFVRSVLGRDRAADVARATERRSEAIERARRANGRREAGRLTSGQRQRQALDSGASYDAMQHLHNVMREQER